MNYEKYEADREAADAAFEEVKAVFSERIAQLISSIYAVASERLPPFISSVYDFLFKPIEFITAIIRRDKAYFGIESPSKLLANKQTILFLCDRRDKCDPCNYPTCQHTADISHAANFIKIGRDYWEQPQADITDEGVNCEIYLAERGLNNEL